MDTSKQVPQKSQAEVAALKNTIKAHMPETYQSILARAAETDLGKQAWALVTRGLRGEPDCFWAMEGGYVVGTPFAQSAISEKVAACMVRYGCSAIVLWALPAAHPQLAGV